MITAWYLHIRARYRHYTSYGLGGENQSIRVRKQKFASAKHLTDQAPKLSVSHRKDRGGGEGNGDHYPLEGGSASSAPHLSG